MVILNFQISQGSEATQ